MMLSMPVAKTPGTHAGTAQGAKPSVCRVDAHDEDAEADEHGKDHRGQRWKREENDADDGKNDARTQAHTAKRIHGEPPWSITSGRFHYSLSNILLQIATNAAHDAIATHKILRNLDVNATRLAKTTCCLVQTGLVQLAGKQAAVLHEGQCLGN